EYDLVIDGSDNFPTRYLANDAAQLLDLPLVWGAILQYHGQVGIAWHRHGPGYRDLFPEPPAPEDVVDCAGGGVLPGLCGTVGSLLATEALKLITGLGDPLLGRVLVYDSLAARTRELCYDRDPEAEPVTELIDYEAFCAGDDGPASVTAAEAIELLRGPDAPPLLDVRTREEHRGRRIPGALSVPLDELEQRIAEFTGPVLVHCERGPRSITAARLLESVAQPRYVQGGIDALARFTSELLEEEEPAS
uniref:ThiF family adenylyltransferase n=1 Tax=uncultured Agrococcus sp. TaxID=382258 RepID=UPI0025E6AAE2